MQIIIDIPKEVYKNIQSKSTKIQAEGYTIENAILNGILLPKGHGDLIDRKILQNNIDDKGIMSPKDISKIQILRKWINNQNPILEADKKVRT